MDIKWYSYTHLKWWILISLPILIIWVISLPVIAMVLLFKNIKKKEKDNKVKEYFLILYQGLKPNRFYWEFVNTLRKLTILSSFLFKSTYKVLFAWSALIITIRFQIALKPYKRDDNNKAEFWAMSSGMLTILWSLIFNSKEKVSALNYMIIIFVMIVNIIFLLNWIKLLLKMFEDKSNKLKIVSL